LLWKNDFPDPGNDFEGMASLWKNKAGNNHVFNIIRDAIPKPAKTLIIKK